MNKRICVVGAGMWGKNHVRVLYEMGVLYGVVEKKSEIINKLRQEYPDVIIFNDLEQALNKDLDGFVVCTPPKTHFEITKKILLSNKHVLVEKPITTNLNDAIELNTIAKKNKLILMVGHVLLFHPAFIKIKEIISSGDIGELQYIYSNRLNLGTIRSHENVLWSFAPHDIALFQYFIGEKPIEITSSGIDIVQSGIHDTTITSLKYNNKIMGHIFVSWLHPFKEHRFVVIGSKGMLHFEDSTDNKPLLYYNKKIKWQNGIPKPVHGEVVNLDYDKTLPLDIELKYFVDNIDSGEISICNGDSAVEVMEILTECEEIIN